MIVFGDLYLSFFLILCLILDMFFAPPYLANIKCVASLYIIPSLPLSFRALCNYSPMHLKYVLFSENASMPNISCGG